MTLRAAAAYMARRRSELRSDVDLAVSKLLPLYEVGQDDVVLGLLYDTTEFRRVAAGGPHGLTA